MLRARGLLFLPCAQGALVPAPRAHLNCIASLGRGMDPGDSERRAHQNLLPAAARPTGASRTVCDLVELSFISPSLCPLYTIVPRSPAGVPSTATTPTLSLSHFGSE